MPCSPPPTGSTGSWNAASGSSSGWQQWNVDLSAYAGGQVEISLAYVSDWSTQGLGVFLDDIAVSTGQGSTDFESDLGGTGFPEGAVVATNDTLLHGLRARGDHRCRHP
jgi:bacillopeptidase F (M6 metalloprotease family)